MKDHKKSEVNPVLRAALSIYANPTMIRVEHGAYPSLPKDRSAFLEDVVTPSLVSMFLSTPIVAPILISLGMKTEYACAIGAGLPLITNALSMLYETNRHASKMDSDASYRKMCKKFDENYTWGSEQIS